MKNSQLSRFEIEKIANRLLPSMLHKEKHNYIEFDFESLGIKYDVEYGRNLYGHWVLYKYVFKPILAVELVDETHFTSI